ncbi:MAG: SO_0444 family Cu/Zn efflux transporter [Desulfotalea sp.]
MLPAATSLKKQGANKGATTAFLISTPESGVDSIAVTYALLDPIMTIIRPVAAFITATIGGILENIFTFEAEKPKPAVPAGLAMLSSEKDDENDKEEAISFPTKLKSGIRFALVNVWGDIAVWFFIGILAAGTITALIPNDAIHTWLGGGISSMLIMLVIGIPLYICATASTPIAAALILKGVSPGAALVFLLVGPATNITSLSVLIGVLGKKSTMRYLFVVATMAVIFGLTTDMIYSLLDISPKAIIGNAGEVLPHSVHLLSTFILLILSIRPFGKKFQKMFNR